MREMQCTHQECDSDCLCALPRDANELIAEISEFEAGLPCPWGAQHQQLNLSYKNRHQLHHTVLFFNFIWVKDDVI